MKTVYIGIGSNLGNPLQNCFDSIDRIGNIPECNIIGISDLYWTEPVGIDDQDWYVNGVVSISTDISAQDLMNRLFEIEKDMGRIRNRHWESRVIDLDMLLFGSDIIHEQGLTVPHPLMHKRRFVLAPMVDLAPDLKHPSFEKTMFELLQAIPEDKQIVKPVENR